MLSLTYNVFEGLADKVKFNLKYWFRTIQNMDNTNTFNVLTTSNDIAKTSFENLKINAINQFEKVQEYFSEMLIEQENEKKIQKIKQEKIIDKNAFAKRAFLCYKRYTYLEQLAKAIGSTKLYYQIREKQLRYNQTKLRSVNRKNTLIKKIPTIYRNL